MQPYGPRQPFFGGAVMPIVSGAPGWYPDPVVAGQLRWWDGGWTSHTFRRPAPAATKAALTLGIVGFVFICFPILGVVLTLAATVLAIIAARRDRDDNFTVSVLTFDVIAFSLSLAGLAYSLWQGLYGIVISPWPA